MKFLVTRKFEKTFSQTCAELRSEWQGEHLMKLTTNTFDKILSPNDCILCVSSIFMCRPTKMLTDSSCGSNYELDHRL